MLENLTREQLLEALKYLLQTGGLFAYQYNYTTKQREAAVTDPGCGCCAGGDFETPEAILETLKTVYESVNARNSKDS